MTLHGRSEREHPLAEHEPALRRDIGEPTIFNQLIMVGLSNECVIFQY